MLLILLQAPLVEEAAQPTRSGSAPSDLPTDSCLEGLPQKLLLSICQVAAAAHMPLTAWLTLERLRQHGLALDSMQWRDLVSGMSCLWLQNHLLCATHEGVTHTHPSPHMPVNALS